MQYKKSNSFKGLLIGSLLFSAMFSQSFFNTVMGEEYFSGSSRSAAMGYSRLSGDNPATLTGSYPAALSRLDEAYSLHFSLSGKSLLEQRSMPLKDMFGDFLEDGVYVVNRDQIGYGNLAIGKGFTVSDFSLGVGLQYSPMSVFHYQYKEEVRDRTSLDDGIIGSKDPLIGYHTLNSSGKTDVLSLGAGADYQINSKLAVRLGMSVNMISDAEFSLSQSVQVIQDTGTNLSEVEPFDLIFNTSSETFTTLSGDVVFSNGITLSTAYESAIELNKTVADSIINFEPSGLSPELTTYLTSYYLNGINSSVLSLPSRFSAGISYAPRAVVPMEFIVEFEFRPYSDITGNIYKDTRTWRVGFEYLAGGKTPVRAGYLFKESPIPSIPPETAFTIGTGRQLGKLNIDLSGRYSLNSYAYPDLFPVDGDVRPDLDTVQETRFDVMATFSMAIGR